MRPPEVMGGAKALPKATYGRALNYMVKSYVGPGCLSLPLAFRHSGIVLGLTMLVLLLVSITWNLRCIIVCKIYFEHRGVKSYADLALVVLGIRGKQCVEWLVNATQLGICAVYFDFVAENLRALLPDIWGNWRSMQVCMIYALPVFSGLALLPSVESIAPYTGLANFLIFFSIFIVLGFSLVQLSNNGPGEGLEAARPLESPLFYATAVYSFEGIANLLPVENALEDRTQIYSLLYVSMGLVGVVYCGVGCLSYLAWPTVTAGSITAELSENYPKSPLLALSSWMVMFAVVLTYPVQLFPAVEILEIRAGFRESTATATPKGGFDMLRDLESPGNAGLSALRSSGSVTLDEADLENEEGEIVGELGSNTISQLAYRNGDDGSDDGGMEMQSIIKSSVASDMDEADYEDDDDGKHKKLNVRHRSDNDSQEGCRTSSTTRPTSDTATGVEEQKDFETEGEEAKRQEGLATRNPLSVSPETVQLAALRARPSQLRQRSPRSSFDMEEGSMNHSDQEKNGGGRVAMVSPMRNSTGCSGEDISSSSRSHTLPPHTPDDGESINEAVSVSATSNNHFITPLPQQRPEAMDSSGSSGDGTASVMPVKQKAFRVGLVVGTLLMAVLIPNLGILIALIGAISGSVLAIILPALIDFKTPHQKTTATTQIIALVSIFCGVLGGIWGSSLALEAVFSGGGEAR